MIKYLLFPGMVKNNNDKHHHYLGPVQLACLYNVRMHDCRIVTDAEEEYPERLHNHGLIELRPRANGNYTLIEKV